MITKGKWEVEIGEGDFIFITSFNGMTEIAKIEKDLNAEANARLIASSKPLLEACKELMDSEYQMPSDIAHKIQQAIKEAEL